jgi:hypothetical protein
MRKEKLMKTTFLNSISLKIHLTIIISISVLFLFLNITGCALSRQFIPTNTGHGYGPSFTSTTMSSEWDFLEQSDSVNEWSIDDSQSRIQKTDCLVEISTGEVTDADNKVNNIVMRPYPTHLYPRGIYTTGTGIIIVVDLYK